MSQAALYTEREAVEFRDRVEDSWWQPDIVVAVTPCGGVVLGSRLGRVLDFADQATLLRPRAPCPVPAPSGADREPAAAMAPAPVRSPAARLEGLDQLLPTVVQRCKGDGLCSSGVNAAIRNLKHKIDREEPCAQVVEDVLDRLVDGGLTEAVEDGAIGKGRRVRRCRWKPWAAIQRGPVSGALCARLGLEERHFLARA